MPYVYLTLPEFHLLRNLNVKNGSLWKGIGIGLQLGASCCQLSIHYSLLDLANEK